MDLQKNGRLSEAKEIYLKILVQSPNDANALHLISLVFMAEGNYEEAKSYIEKAINEAPDQAVFHSNYGGLLHTMGDLPASVKVLKKSLKLDKKLFLVSLLGLSIKISNKIYILLCWQFSFCKQIFKVLSFNNLFLKNFLRNRF